MEGSSLLTVDHDNYTSDYSMIKVIVMIVTRNQLIIKMFTITVEL